MNYEYELNDENAFYFVVPLGIFMFMMVTCCLWPESEEKILARHVVHRYNVIADNSVYQLSQANQSRRRQQARHTKIGLILIWILLIIVVYYMLPVTSDNEEFNPYTILNVDEQASVSEIQQAYHRLSKLHHPDRGGDPEKFQEIARAYETLTDAQARENWMKYGNPDGPRELHLGFAIPNWFSMFILCTYSSFFLIIPVLGCFCACAHS